MNREIGEKRYGVRMVVLVVVAALLYCVYAAFFAQDSITLVNVLLFCAAMTAMSWGLADMAARGARIANAFAVCFFAVLALNNLNISGLQAKKTLIDVYFFLFGPLIFLCILSLLDRDVHPQRKVFAFDPNVVTGVLLCLYWLGKLIIFNKTGIKFFASSWAGMTGNEFVVPGLSGVVEMLMWISLMMIPSLKKGMKVAVAFSALLLSGVLMASRGNMMRIGIYLALCFVYAKRTSLFTKRNVCILVSVFLIGIIGFGIAGDFRQAQRGWDMSQITIGSLLESRTRNNIINWAFAYTGISFDVLKQIYIPMEPSGGLSSLLMPLMRLFGGNELVMETVAASTTHGLNGFNASTFLSGFVADLGIWYFGGVALLALLVAFLARCAKCIEATGVYVFLMMLAALCLFGNYYFSPNLFFSIIAALLVCCFVNTREPVSRKKQCGEQRNCLII